MRDMPPQPDPTDPDRDSDPFDPQRFGKISFTTSFFKRLITTSLPEPKAEDLVDSIPPGEGPDGAEVLLASSLYTGKDRSEGGSACGASGNPFIALDKTMEKKFFLSPEEAQVLRRGPRKRHSLLAAILVGGAAGALATVLWAAMGEQTPPGQEQTLRSPESLRSSTIPRPPAETQRARSPLGARAAEAPPPGSQEKPASSSSGTAPENTPVASPTARTTSPAARTVSPAARKEQRTPTSDRGTASAPTAPAPTAVRTAAPTTQSSTRPSLLSSGDTGNAVHRESAPKASGHSPFEPR